MPASSSSTPHHPHDAFFKEVFADLVNARELIERHAPPEVVAVIDLDSLEQLDTSFIDEDLQQHFADLAFKVKIKQGGEAYICLLLEHKSYPDKWVLLQLLRYKLQIWDNARKQSSQYLQVVFPMVVYHGKRKWRVAKQFNSLFNLTDLSSLQPYVPNFAYHLFDLSVLDDQSLDNTGLVNAALGTMKHIFDDEIQSKLGRILRQLRSLPPEKMKRYVQIVLRYIMTNAANLTRKEFEQIVRDEIIDEELSEGAMTLAQQLILEGRNEGRLEGKQAGLLEGKQAGLIEGKQAGFIEIATRLLRRRFNTIPTDTTLLLRQIPIEYLAEFNVALLDFANIDEARAWLQQHSVSAN
ncbi:MAG: Rpn family recombination-promoting nuclease/putative transposase [Anaerolineae bacterium]|nr:Rpn family recombination-promoting nuclease/putative transposase [Anaerolineae bacterium]